MPKTDLAPRRKQKREAFRKSLKSPQSKDQIIEIPIRRHKPPFKKTKII